MFPLWFSAGFQERVWQESSECYFLILCQTFSLWLTLVLSLTFLSKTLQVKPRQMLLMAWL